MRGARSVLQRLHHERDLLRLLEAVEAESAILPQIVRNEGRPGHQQAETQHGKQDIHSLEYLLKEV